MRFQRPLLRIVSVQAKPKSKFRPQPMDTVTLEKLASRKLRMTAKEALSHAEKLYTEGICEIRFSYSGEYGSKRSSEFSIMYDNLPDYGGLEPKPFLPVHKKLEQKC